MNQTITFEVPGTCKPAGSKRAFLNKWTGRVVVTDDCTKSRDWKTDVTWAAKAAYKGPLLTVALAVNFEFVVRRPDGHYGSGKNADKIKPGAPRWPVVKPDCLKLARAVEDALSGIIYRDDSQIVQEVMRKDYAASKGGFVGVRVTITPLETMPVNGEQRELIASEAEQLL